MENKDVVSKIKELAYENVNKKLEEEIKRTEERINKDLEDVQKCLKYIQNRMVFKIIRSSNCNPIEYVLADEETFFQDYNKEARWNKGIRFKEENDKPYEPLFKVNDERYYDVQYIIRRYEEDFNYYNRRLNDLLEKFGEIEKGAESLKRQELLIKSLLEQLKKCEVVE